MAMSCWPSTIPSMSRPTDRGMLSLPGLFLKKNEPIPRGRTPSQTSRQNATRKEKSHPFFAKPLHAILGKVAQDEEPLLQKSREEAQQTMNISSLVESFKKVTHLDTVPENKKGEDSSFSRYDYSAARYMLAQPELKMKTSEASQRTSTTASASESISTGSCDNTWMTLSPPSSPRIHITTATQNSPEFVPYDEGVDDEDVDTYCDEILATYESDEEGQEIVFVPASQHDYGSYGQDINGISWQTPPRSFLDIIEDCEARWSSYVQPLRENRLIFHSSANSSNDSLSSNDSVKAIEQDNSLSDKKICAQSSQEQVEIENLKEELLRQQAILLAQEEVHSRLRPPPKEEIDTIPMDEVEITNGPNDEISLNSGVTYMNDSSFHNGDDASAMMARRPPRRPDAASDSDCESVLPTTKVHDFPLKLKAANGIVRNALYTGPRKGGACTGVGILRFETGDVYMGEVVNGKVCGQLIFVVFPQFIFSLQFVFFRCKVEEHTLFAGTKKDGRRSFVVCLKTMYTVRNARVSLCIY